MKRIINHGPGEALVTVNGVGIRMGEGAYIETRDDSHVIGQARSGTINVSVIEAPDPTPIMHALAATTRKALLSSTSKERAAGMGELVSALSQYDAWTGGRSDQ